MRHKIMKAFIVFVVLAFAFSLAPAGAVRAAGPWFVRPDGSDAECNGTVDAAYDAAIAPACAYATIPQAVSSAEAGDTVNVTAGTYNTLVVINKTLTLVGPNASVNPNTGTRASEAVLTAPLQPGLADNIQIRGFKFSGVTTASGTQGAIDNQSNPGGNNLLVENNIFENLNGVHAISRWQGAPYPSGWIIRNNRVQIVTGTNISAFYLAGGVTSVQLTGNYVEDVPYSAILLGNAHNSTISGNTVKNVGAQAIQLSGTSGNVSIFGNSIDDAGNILNEADKGGIRLYGTQFDGPVSVYSNTITNSKNGIGIRETEDITGKDIRVYWNSVDATNEVGIYNGATGTLNASCNWWGEVSGPMDAGNTGGTGSTLSGAVTFGPWLVTDADDSTDPGFQLPATVTVTPTGEVSEAENDFRVLQNAIGCATTNQTIDLSGTFDWSEEAPLANAAYLDSYNGTVYGDIRGVEIPGVNGLTITSSATDAHILGVGDVDDGALIFSTFLFSEQAPGNTGLTVENLNIDNFEGAVTLGWNATGTFPNTMVRNNQVTLAGDNGDATDWMQNVAFYFWNGANQTLRNNTVTFVADGTRTVGYSGPKNGASFGYQSGTTGGNAYNGLTITANIFQVGDTSNGVEETYGIWENGHNDTAGVALNLTYNQFRGRVGDDFDHAFLLSSQTDGLQLRYNIFNRVDDVFLATRSQGHSNGDRFIFANNTLISVGGADGIFLRNVTNDATPIHVAIHWNINNTIDGETGIRGLNELSTQASHHSRPTGAATDLTVVLPLPTPVSLSTVNDDWGTVDRFSDPDGLDTGFTTAFGYNTFSTVQAAISGTAAGGTVQVLAGTYPETGQIVIAKNLTLVGEDAETTILKPTANTGTSGDARGWFLVNSGMDFNLSNFTLDGAGYQINRGIQSRGTGEISNNVFKNIAAPGYQGVGIAMYNSMTVTNNEFTNIGRIGTFAFGADADSVVIQGNTYTGKGEGNWLDYGIELGGGAVGTITGNVIQNNLGVATSDGSTSAGMLITTYFGPGTTAEITGNTLMNNTAGVAVGYDANDTSTVTASFNRIVGNEYGITTTAPAVSAENNWWGCNEGPGSAGCDSVDSNVDADPWLELSANAIPASVQPLATSVVTPVLMTNSDDEDTTGDGFVPDGIPAAYTAPDGGSLDPTTGVTVDGIFTPTTFTTLATDEAYQVCVTVDNEALCVDVTVQNVAPVAAADNYTSGSNATLTVVVADGVLKNDTDGNGDALTAVLNTETTHGDLVFNADGSFTYTPDALFTGTDTFTYHVTDGTAVSSIVTVTIKVEDQNHHYFFPFIGRGG